jgi:hypothetical protein
MTSSEALNATIETAKTNFATAGPACQAWRKAKRVINGHMVQVNIFNSAEPIVWLDGSSESLTAAEALTRIA